MKNIKSANGFGQSVTPVSSWNTSNNGNGNGGGNGWGPGGNGGNHHPPWAVVPEVNAFGGILVGAILLWFVFLRRIRK